jgi:hypothetical protein
MSWGEFGTGTIGYLCADPTADTTTHRQNSLRLKRI